MAVHDQLEFFQWNCNGIRSKAFILENCLQHYKPDIFALTETKLNGDISDNEICSKYTLYRYDRSDNLGRGGGVLIGISDLCPISVNHVEKCPLGEILSLNLSISGFSFRFSVYYHRPMHTDVNDIINWYNSVLEPNVLIVGDFKRSLKLE